MKRGLFLGLFWGISVIASPTPALTKMSQSSEYSPEFRQQLTACNHGNTKACSDASFTLYNFGDMPKVIVIAQKMCLEKAYAECTFLGDMYTNGYKGVLYNPQKGFYWYTKACKGGDQQGCRTLKDFSLQGGKVIHNTLPKIKKLTQACDTGDKEACIDLAVRYKGGIGVKKNYKMALKRFDQGCKGNRDLRDRRCEGKMDILEELKIGDFAD
jgi:TPR repeat protein